MVRRLKQFLTRRQAKALVLVAMVEVAALVGGILGSEIALWGGLAFANLLVLAVLFRVLNRVNRHDASAREQWRGVQDTAGAAAAAEPEQVEVLLRRVLATVEHERRLTSRRFEQLVGARPADEDDLDSDLA
ncbi:hypothetical protein AB0B28_04135 [Glycomyces sp. NPDC046736]|uniref:hypothetical protein n=1 Tax=Glycomyces sp. NPDC046736 TaxID=3155615 RepID=UPI0033D3E532